MKFASCMRSHGVPRFPNPDATGQLRVNYTSGLNPFSPAFKAAQAACGKLLPGGAQGPGPASQQRGQQLTLAKCMRAHGITNFPDPISSPPSNVNKYWVVFGQPGAIIAVPRTIKVQAPAFKQAEAACQFPVIK